MHDGAEVNVLLFRTQTHHPKGLILYFHGNADNLQRWGHYAVDLTPLGYDVLMVEYRGYGKSGGKSSEDNFYKDAQMILQWAEKNFEYSKLVIYGRSLGTAVATNLASTSNPDLLILETPFDELWGVVYPVFRPILYFVNPRHRFSNTDHLPQVTCKTLIIHGTRDWVVPLSSALRLKPLLKEGDEFVIIEGGGHYDLREYEEYHRALAGILR